MKRKLSKSEIGLLLASSAGVLIVIVNMVIASFNASSISIAACMLGMFCTNLASILKKNNKDDDSSK